MRLLGSLAVLEEVFTLFMPSILAQKDLRRAADFFDFAACSFLTGGFKLEPGCDFSYDLRPVSLRPPLEFLPAERVHASVFDAVFFFTVMASS